ncbi:inactive pancreatic lipase-related protein 1-like isoform X2 [Argiope bruennichi]|uniref:inactive pancreatic lipase-related protein 1-like isoform X2 n=1 Tax=Argiope bruennichi TaxID=94029 RepID=UPI002494B4C0|nr:inactive pancreatic lipase-related protein 1-like isoform X2 [Argiope bruennichi]
MKAVWKVFFVHFCVSTARIEAFFKNPIKIPTFNPLEMLFVNKCMEELGCFYTGGPFFHPIIRPISLPPVDSPKPKFYLFTRTNPNEAYNLEITQDSLKNSLFNPEVESKFFIHGFYFPMKPDDIRYKTKDALLERGEYNVFVVDWTEYNGPLYAQATANTRVIGAVIAKMINFLIAETGVSPESFHLIGHSLGAHTAGYAGERVPNLGRITGLDPAGPYFYKLKPEARLDPTDALFVDVIHTDGADIILMVTAFFMFNGCDHERANIYFYESVKSDCGFVSQICDDYSSYENGKCENSAVTARMGLNAQMLPELHFPAKFFLRTNGQSPFCIK